MAVVIVLVAEALPWLTQQQIEASQAAARAGDAGTAVARAADARDIEPWAASPRLQLALVEEAARNLRAAQGAIKAAIRRDPTDWNLWFAYTRIEVRAGHPRRALAGLARIRKLNPLLTLTPATP